MPGGREEKGDLVGERVGHFCQTEAASLAGLLSNTVAIVKNVLYAPKLLTRVDLDDYYHKGMIHM